MDQELFSPVLLQEIRSKFHYVKNSLYGGERLFLDSVSGALRLKKMTDRAGAEIKSYAQKSRIDPASRHFAAVKERFKKDARLFFGADSGHIIPAMSGTHTVYRCINAVCSAYKDAGKNIVTSNLEHPAVFESTHQFAEKYNLERRIADFDRKKGVVPVENVLNLIDKDTCLLALIHGSNITGGVNDVGEIVREARAINPGIYVVVDGVQYAPHRLIDVEELDVDAYIISGYKIYCKKGSGIGYISERFDELPHWQMRERPAGEWAIGAEDESTYAGFSAVISYLKWLGGQLIAIDGDKPGTEKKSSFNKKNFNDKNEKGSSKARSRFYKKTMVRSRFYEKNNFFESDSFNGSERIHDKSSSGERDNFDERRKIELAMEKISSHTKGLMKLALDGFEGYQGSGNIEEAGDSKETGETGRSGAQGNYCEDKSGDSGKLKNAGIRGLRQMKNVDILGLQNCPGKRQPAEPVYSHQDRPDHKSEGQNDGQHDDLDLEGRTGLIAFRIKGKNSNELAKKYYKEAGISLSTRERNIYGRHVLEVLGVDDLIRLSVCHYNSPEEIKSFLQATEKFQ